MNPGPRRLLALPVLVVAVAAIIFGRFTHTTPIAIAGYALLAVAVVLGLLTRR